MLVLGSWIRMRRTDRALEEFAETSGELGTLVGTRWREGDEREKQLVALQASVERMTRWLVALTIVVGLIGIASIAAALWAALG